MDFELCTAAQRTAQFVANHFCQMGSPGNCLHGSSKTAQVSMTGQLCDLWLQVLGCWLGRQLQPEAQLQWSHALPKSQRPWLDHIQHISAPKY